MENPPRVSIILPTLNESGHILALIDAIHAVMRMYVYEIIVVDDHSPDGTHGTVCAKKDPRVKAFLHEGIPGLADSVGQGLKAAQGDILVVMDSDFNHQPAYLPDMIARLEDGDAVFASRFLPGGGMRPAWRQFISKQYNGFIRQMIGGSFQDHLYGFYALKRHVFEALPYADIFWGYGDYAMRLVYYLQKQKRSVTEFPAQNGERPTGTGNRRWGSTFMQYTKEVWRLKQKESAADDV